MNSTDEGQDGPKRFDLERVVLFAGLERREPWPHVVVSENNINNNNNHTKEGRPAHSKKKASIPPRAEPGTMHLHITRPAD